MKKILGPVVLLDDNQDYQWLQFLIQDDGKITIKKAAITNHSTELTWVAEADLDHSKSPKQTFFVFDPETNNHYLYVHQINDKQQHTLHRLPVKKMSTFMWSFPEKFQMGGTPWLLQQDRALQAKYDINTYTKLEILSDEVRDSLISKAAVLRKNLSKVIVEKNVLEETEANEKTKTNEQNWKQFKETNFDYLKTLIKTKLSEAAIFHLKSCSFENDFDSLKTGSHNQDHYIESLKAVLSGNNNFLIEKNLYDENTKTNVDSLRSILYPNMINQLFSPQFLIANKIDEMTIFDVKFFFVDLIEQQLILLGVPKSEIVVNLPNVPDNIKMGGLEKKAETLIRSGLSQESLELFNEIHALLTSSKSTESFSEEKLVIFSQIIKAILAKNYQSPYQEWQLIMDDYYQVRAVNSQTYDEDVEKELKTLQRSIENQLEEYSLLNLIRQGKKQEAIIRFKEIIKDRAQLVSILTKINIEYRLTLFKMLPEDYILSIIKNAKDVNALLQVVRYQDYKSVLEKLGESFKGMVQDTDDFEKVLHSLHKKNILAEAIIDIHGLEYFKRFSFLNSAHIHYGLFWQFFGSESSSEERSSLCKKLDSEYLKSISFGPSEFFHLLFTLEDENAKLILTMLGEEFIERMMMLDGSSDFLRSRFGSVVSPIRPSDIVWVILNTIAKVNPRKFNHWFSNSDQISLALSKIPEKNHNSFLMLCDLRDIKAFINNAKQLISFFSKLTVEKQASLLDELGKEYLQRIFDNHDEQMFDLLLKTNTFENFRMVLIVLDIDPEHLRRLIPDNKSLFNLLAELPKENYGSLLEMLGKKYLQINAVYLSHDVVSMLPQDAKFLLLEMMPVECLREAENIMQMMRAWTSCQNHFKRLIKLNEMENQFDHLWHNENSMQKNITEIFKPISSAKQKILHFHFNTRGERYATEILDECTKRREIYLPQFYEFLGKQLEMIDANADRADLFGGGHPTAFGETAMRIMFVRHKVGEMIHNELPQNNVIQRRQDDRLTF